MRNLITDIAGIRVGHASDAKLASGTTVVVFDRPVVASVDVRGGGPGTRETALLDPAQTIEGIDAIVLSGGSAFGLDAASGVQAFCASRAAASASATPWCRSCPAAILFDLLNGGDKNWGRYPPYRDLGYEAAKGRRHGFRARQRRRRPWRDHRDLKGGVGSASAVTTRRHHRRRARRGQRRRHDRDRQRSAFLGGGIRAEQANSAGAAFRRKSPARRCRLRAKGGRGREHHHRRRRHRRQAYQGAVQPARGDGAGRLCPRHLSRAHAARRRRGVCRGNRRQAARRSVSTASPSSACWRQTCWRAPSPAASMRRRRCRSRCAAELEGQVRIMPSFRRPASAAVIQTAITMHSCPVERAALRTKIRVRARNGAGSM